MDKIKEFKGIVDHMSKIYEAKNHDYGNSFDQSLDKYGYVASSVRMSDKLNRFDTLTKSEMVGQVKEESIEDTLLDLANYAIMTVIYMRNNEKDI